MTGAKTGPRAIFFDVGETLVRPRRAYDELLAEVSEALGVALPADIAGGLAARIEVRVTERSQQGLPFTFPADASRQFWFETYHGFLVDLMATTDARRLAEGLLKLLSSTAGYAPFDDAIPTLKRLRAKGYRLGIISNWEAWLPTLLRDCDLAPFFQHVVISGVCGVEKPDARIYTLAMEEGGYQPGEVIYVGDRPAHDVIPAKQTGLIPILIDRGDRYRQHDATSRIGSLSELPAVLEKLVHG